VLYGCSILKKKFKSKEYKMLSWKINPVSLKLLSDEMASLDKTIRRKAIRTAAKKWSIKVINAIKSNIDWNEGTIQDYLDFKVKSLKRGQILWIGVGSLAGKKIRTESNAGTAWVASKVRWYNDGWRPVPKGYKSGRKGRGWRKGVRNLGGTVYYNTKFVDRAHAQTQDSFVQIVSNEIIKAINESKS
jgi:hypothetical protein